MLLYQQGEYGAFEQLYSKYSPRVYAHIKYRVFQAGEAEDLLQQVFLKLHQHRLSFDGALPFLPWLFTIVRNTLIDHFRKHRTVLMEEEELTAIADHQTGSTPGVDGATSWDEILKLLPEEQRQLIQLRFEEGLSFDEIARMSGLNETSARKRFSRTMQGLRKVFKAPKKGAG